ncbi:STAS domain-containing protein [Streptomyces erythrochromogenes]|uniref:STAS domain-containing protein n=1 Tax=Streptomyces erythrochromogenes TaxID=285574 RepID=UPI0036ADB21C
MTSTLQTFDVAVSVQPGRAVVAVTGELDMDTCPQLAAATDALDLADQRLTVDLSHVTFMDCAALHQLLALRRRALDQHGRLELSAIPDHALRMLDHTGTRHLFTLCPRRIPAPAPPDRIHGGR